MYSEIKDVTDSVFGRPKSDYGSSGWYEYNCPCCREENGGVDDNRHNLAILLDPDDNGKLWGHCWRCGYSGNLTRLVKENGTPYDIDRLRDVISIINAGNSFSDPDGDKKITEETVTLPEGYRMFFSGSDNEKRALDYLHMRGVPDSMIRRFNIGYVTEGRYTGRVVIPSYDRYGSLNYWVARDYTGKSKIKVKNPSADKTSIVFNEGLVNWYEPITLVEGPFDHIVVPNSIPLLGKTLDYESAVYKALYSRSRCNINILLDPDAKESAIRLYRKLDSGDLMGRIRIAECPEELDASDVYREYGREGMVSILRRARKISCFE